MDPDSYRVKVGNSYLTSDKINNIQKVPEILKKLGKSRISLYLSFHILSRCRHKHHHMLN